MDGKNNRWWSFSFSNSDTEPDGRWNRRRARRLGRSGAGRQRRRKGRWRGKEAAIKTHYDARSESCSDKRHSVFTWNVIVDSNGVVRIHPNAVLSMRSIKPTGPNPTWKPQNKAGPTSAFDRLACNTYCFVLFAGFAGPGDGRAVLPGARAGAARGDDQPHALGGARAAQVRAGDPARRLHQLMSPGIGQNFWKTQYWTYPMGFTPG